MTSDQVQSSSAARERGQSVLVRTTDGRAVHYGRRCQPAARVNRLLHRRLPRGRVGDRPRPGRGAATRRPARGLQQQRHQPCQLWPRPPEHHPRGRGWTLPREYRPHIRDRRDRRRPCSWRPTARPASSSSSPATDVGSDQRSAANLRGGTGCRKCRASQQSEYPSCCDGGFANNRCRCEFALWAGRSRSRVCRYRPHARGRAAAGEWLACSARRGRVGEDGAVGVRRRSRGRDESAPSDRCRGGVRPRVRGAAWVGVADRG